MLSWPRLYCLEMGLNHRHLVLIIIIKLTLNMLLRVKFDLIFLCCLEPFLLYFVLKKDIPLTLVEEISHKHTLVLFNSMTKLVLLYLLSPFNARIYMFVCLCSWSKLYYLLLNVYKSFYPKICWDWLTWN